MKSKGVFYFVCPSLGQLPRQFLRTWQSEINRFWQLPRQFLTLKGFKLCEKIALIVARQTRQFTKANCLGCLAIGKQWQGWVEFT